MRPVAFAYVNRGRWLANCPLGCGAATEAEYEWFVCRGCLNAGNDGHRVPLIWPVPADIVAIEAALAVRPLYARNWELNESIGSLVTENFLYGLFDPVTGAIAGDIGASHNRLPGYLALAGAQLELGP